MAGFEMLVLTPSQEEGRRRKNTIGLNWWTKEKDDK